MRKLLVILVMLVAMNANAQWQPDVRLTNDTSSSNTTHTNGWGIASSGNFVHVVWYDNRDGGNGIYYKRSIDGGSNWSADLKLLNSQMSAWDPSIAISGSVVHVVWYFNYAFPGIYYRRSTDSGISWGDITALSTGSSLKNSPSIAVSGSVVHIVYRDLTYGWNLNYIRSTNGGVNWGSDISLSNAYISYGPSVTVSGQYGYIVWSDSRDGNFEIYCKRSSNDGINWGTDMRLTNDTNKSDFPSVTAFGSAVHVVWFDNRDGNNEIYYKHSTDGGLNWGADTRLTNNPADSKYPSVAVSGSTVHVVWSDYRNSQWEIYYKRSIDGGISWGEDTRLTNVFQSDNPFISVSGSAVHVIWNDLRDGNEEIYYKRNPTGNPTVVQNISTETQSKYSLSQNYPNPFNPTTNIKFSIVNSGDVKLVVYDIQGREVQTLVNERLLPGTYETAFDASSLNSGVYFYKLITNGFTETKKMLMIK